MNRNRIIAALLTVLGFSASCGSSRKASKKENSKAAAPEIIEETIPEIRLMYGPPRNVFIEAERVEADSTTGKSPDGKRRAEDDNSRER